MPYQLLRSGAAPWSEAGHSWITFHNENGAPVAPRFHYRSTQIRTLAKVDSPCARLSANTALELTC